MNDIERLVELHLALRVVEAEMQEVITVKIDLLEEVSNIEVKERRLLSKKADTEQKISEIRKRYPERRPAGYGASIGRGPGHWQ